MTTASPFEVVGAGSYDPATDTLNISPVPRVYPLQHATDYDCRLDGPGRSRAQTLVILSEIDWALKEYTVS